MERECTAVVIEDDVEVATLIKIILEQAGLRVVVAASGEAGVAAVLEHRPLLTTVDVNLPGTDGFAITRQLRETSDTHLIMISGHSGDGDVLRGVDAGAHEYVAKPFRPRDLRARAEAVVRRHREADAQPDAQLP